MHKQHSSKLIKLLQRSCAWTLAFLVTTATLLFSQSGQPESATIQYTGESLSMVQFPIGGVGTGNILLGGRGQIEHLELFNRPNRTERADQTFFSIWIKEEEKEPVARILERNYLPPYHLNALNQLRGIRRFDEVLFESNFPFANLSFSDDEVPLLIELEAFNPFIPLDPENSGIPAAIFNWKIKNPTDRTIEMVLAFSMNNPVRGRQENDQLSFGGNLNQYVKTDQYTGIKMTNTRSNPSDFSYAEVFFGTTAPVDDWQTHWYHGSYGVGQIAFWYEFSRTGKLHPVKEERPSPGRSSDVASVTVRLSLQPGEEKIIPFYLTWYAPNRRTTPTEALGQMESVDKVFKNYYATRFGSATDALEYMLKNYSMLHSQSREFVNLINQSTYPLYVKDALLSQAATIKTPLIHRMENGDVHGFEGVTPNGWCCPGTCTHVWNYEQTLAFLFPSLERTMREVSFLHDTHPNGYQAFRSVFPLGKYWFDGPPAADGQFGNIVRVYREWKMEGDNEWLRKLWPNVKLALEFAWKGSGKVDDPKLKYQENRDIWDPEKEGILRGEQHNTYDINFYGPSSMTSSLYLAALKACTEMAGAMGEPEKAREYDAVFKRGQKNFEKLLWNGEYYIQIIEQKRDKTGGDSEYGDFAQSPPDSKGNILPRYQYGNGCLSDQLLGQFLAHTAGLGYVLKPERVDSAMASVFKYNFLKKVSSVDMYQRTYAYNDESGLLLCSWPDGNRPVIPFVYSDEIWTGVEYQVASSLIYSGYVEEGLTVAKAVRDRYDGKKRNPFAEDESGVHYARAMASWGLLLSLSGFQYDGIAKKMMMAPKINQDNFYTFWSTGSGWGSFAVNNKQLSLRVSMGQQQLKEFSIRGKYEFSKIRSVMINGKSVRASFSAKGDVFAVQFRNAVNLNAGDVMQITLD